MHRCAQRCTQPLRAMITYFVSNSSQQCPPTGSTSRNCREDSAAAPLERPSRLKTPKRYSIGHCSICDRVLLSLEDHRNPTALGCMGTSWELHGAWELHGSGCASRFMIWCAVLQCSTQVQGVSDVKGYTPSCDHTVWHALSGPCPFDLKPALAWAALH